MVCAVPAPPRISTLSRSSARRFGTGHQGPVALAVMPSLADEWLPRLLERYARNHPDVRIRAIDEPSPEVHRLVLTGEVQVGVAGQAGVVHPCNGGVLLKPLGHLLRILAVAGHAQGESFQALKNLP